MTKKILLFGVRRRQNRARWERENQSSGTFPKNSEDGLNGWGLVSSVKVTIVLELYGSGTLDRIRTTE